jgi:predicted nuclease of restriction endonuclease-like (RecB) superfamily
MRRFYSVYSDPQILRQAVAVFGKIDRLKKLPQLVAEIGGGAAQVTPPEFLRPAVAEVPSGQHLQILNKVEAPAARLFYLRATAKLGWSRNVLLNQIKARGYERSLAAGKTHNFPAVLPEYLAEQAEEALKSSYNLEFLGIRREVKERELENLLIERVQQFILELDYGFCFIGRQHRLSLGKTDFFIDLLFYHRFLKALVAVELKIGSFEPEYAGKIDFYLNLLNEKERGPGDNPSIGIILCAEKDDFVVEFSLKTKSNPIGVAEYHLTEKLPKELRGKLPTERQLLAAVRKAIET